THASGETVSRWCHSLPLLGLRSRDGTANMARASERPELLPNVAGAEAAYAAIQSRTPDACKTRGASLDGSLRQPPRSLLPRLPALPGSSPARRAAACARPPW